MRGVLDQMNEFLFLQDDANQEIGRALRHCCFVLISLPNRRLTESSNIG